MKSTYKLENKKWSPLASSKEGMNIHASRQGMILISGEPRTASSAGLKHSKAWLPLTSWRAEDRHHQQVWNTARHGSHSLPGEQRTGIVTSLKHNKAWQPLTIWRAEDRHHQQAWNTTRHGSHSLAGEQRTGIFSRLETQYCMEATHFLESRG